MQDIVQAQPLHFFGSRLKRLAEHMQADVARFSQDAGIPVQVGQFPILAALAEGGPANVTALAKAMRFSQPAVTQAVAKLREAGLVEISRDASDARQRPVALTRAGADLLGRAQRETWPLVEAAVRETLDSLGGDLLGQIDALEAALDRHPLSARATRLAPRDLVPVTDAEVPEVATFINRAYRNIGEAKGWTSEEAYVTGDRTSAADLRADLRAAPDGALLAWRRRANGATDGCVWLAPIEGRLWYMGTLSIAPAVQNAGLGRRLLAEAEAFMTARGAGEVEITVVDVRDTLIAWYERRGYRPTGETRPWPYGDDRFGTPLRDGLNFIVLRKGLA